MELKSPNFNNNEFIPIKYTCEGDNINPELKIINPPEDTISLALIVEDPDAPHPDFTHWIVWNISSRTRSIFENILPIEAIQGINDMGRIQYDGPCPPSGVHRYIFKLFALNTKLDLTKGSTKEDLLHQINNSIIDSTQLIGLYEKQHQV